MKGIILYKSKYGATQKYAMWLSQKTGFEYIDITNADINIVKEFDVIIIGGGIYASSISGISFLKKNIDVLQNKKIIVFCTGASSFDKKAFKQIINYNLGDKFKNIPCFYCRGAWDMDKMNMVDKNLCILLKKAAEKKKEEDYHVWEKALMAIGDNKYDWTDIKYIEPILEEIK